MLKTYPGPCHCGSTRFEVTLELDHARVCDCSICRRRGALNHRVPEAALRILTPLDALAVYQWHTGNAKDYFCPKCGIQPFRASRGYICLTKRRHKASSHLRDGRSMYAVWMMLTWIAFQSNTLREASYPSGRSGGNNVMARREGRQCRRKQPSAARERWSLDDRNAAETLSPGCGHCQPEPLHSDCSHRPFVQPLGAAKHPWRIGSTGRNAAAKLRSHATSADYALMGKCRRKNSKLSRQQRIAFSRQNMT
jgi:hypothetical protein